MLVGRALLLRGWFVERLPLCKTFATVVRQPFLWLARVAVLKSDNRRQVGRLGVATRFHD
jgi:hypothetical protein